MRDLKQDWITIVEALAEVEKSRLFARPLIILAHDPPYSSPPGEGTQKRQIRTVEAMIAQANVGTKAYTSGHQAPLLWQIRVDEGKILGLVFLQLELKLETNGMTKRGRVRLVSSRRHEGEGWALETVGHMAEWQGARRMIDAARCSLPSETERTYRQVHETTVPNIIDAMIREADRLDHVLSQAFGA